MIKFVILMVCGLACLTQATPAKLSKEFVSAQQIERQQAIKELQNFDFIGAFVKVLLKSPEKAVANVNELLTKNNNAVAEEVLNAFNAGLNARIFVINGDYIEVDQAAFGRMLFENTRGFAQLFYPSLQQRSASSMYQRKIQEYANAIEFKQPLKQFTAVLAAERQQIGVRSFSLSFAIDSIVLSISSFVSSIVSTMASLSVKSLTSIVTLINNSLAWLQTNISWLFTLVNPIGGFINNTLQRIIDLLSPLITDDEISRKRRDVTQIADSTTDSNNIFETLLNYLSQGLASIIGAIGDNITTQLTSIRNYFASIVANFQEILNSIFGIPN